MNSRPVLTLFLSVLLTSLPATFSLSPSDGTLFDDEVSVYNVSTNLVDDVKESTFTMKMKCRDRTDDIMACSLTDPKYRTIYHKTPCENSTLCSDEQNLMADSSYVGNFEIKHSGVRVEWLTVSSGTSLKQLSFYRIMANHLFFGVDVDGKIAGSYPMIEESVYGKCEALVKIVRTARVDATGENHGMKIGPSNMVSVKKTRNLESCYPVPGLLIFDAFFYHPMVASVHYDIKTSVSRFIVSDKTFTSYTTEGIAVKSLERGGNTTMLYVRTTVTQHALERATGPIPHIIDPVNVELPFVDGFDPSNRRSDSTDKNIHTSTVPTM